MEFRQLIYFVQVADQGSFSRAATFLGVAQSALSHQVRQLEVELGRSLLHRNGRGASLTSDGKRFLAHSRGILQQVQRARADARDADGLELGHVVVGLPTSVARRLAIPLVKDFRLRFPSATIGIAEGMSAHLIEWITTGRIDLSLAYNALPNAGLEIQPLVDEPLLFVAPRSMALPAGPVPVESLAVLPLLLPTWPHSNRMCIESELARRALKPKIVLEIDGVAPLLDLVVEGIGFGVLPLNVVRGHPQERRLQLRELKAPGLTMELAALLPANRNLTTLAKKVLDRIRSLTPSILGV